MVLLKLFKYYYFFLIRVKGLPKVEIGLEPKMISQELIIGKEVSYEIHDNAKRNILN